ncbi:MAG: hypothetical protein WCO84_01390 [bacterium]
MLQLVKVLKYNCETKETMEVEEEMDVMTAEEAEAKRLLDEANIVPTIEEQNRADIDYLSIMLGVEL